MKCVNVMFHPRHVEDILKHGMRQTRVVAGGIPPDAQLRGSGFSEAHGCFFLCFEHESFADVPPGGTIPLVTPTFEVVQEPQ